MVRLSRKSSQPRAESSAVGPRGATLAVRLPIPGRLLGGWSSRFRPAALGTRAPVFALLAVHFFFVGFAPAATLFADRLGILLKSRLGS